MKSKSEYKSPVFKSILLLSEKPFLAGSGGSGGGSGGADGAARTAPINGGDPTQAKSFRMSDFDEYED